MRTQDPWVVLQTVAPDHLERKLADPVFRKSVDDLRRTTLQAAETPAWFQQRHHIVRNLRADRVIDAQMARLEEQAQDFDAVLDTVGGEMLDRSFAVLEPGGVFVSSVAVPDQDMVARRHVRGVFFLVAVTSEGLSRIANMLDSGHLMTNVGEVLPLAEARQAHEMLAGAPHKHGKIVLTVGV